MQQTIKLSLLCGVLLTSLNAADALELAPVTVYSASKTSQPLQDVTADVNIITAAEIEEKKYTTVTEALNTLPGINVTSNGGLGKSTSVYVRGMNSKRVLVLIDGIRYNDITGLNGAPFEHLMINDIEQIEVIKGAQSGVWGADASAGVINIITKSAQKGLHASAHLEVGSFKTRKYGARASYKADNYYIDLASSKLTTDGFTAQAPRGEDIDNYETDGYVNTTSTIKAGFNFNDTNTIDIEHTLIDATNHYDTYGDPDGNALSTTRDTFSKINFHHIDSFNELDIYTKHSVFSREYAYGEYDGTVREYGLKSKISYAEEDFLVWGIDHKVFKHKNDLNERYNNTAGFLTNSNSFEGLIGGKTIFTQSLRYDTYDEFDNKLTGKIGIKHIASKFKGLYATANIGTAYNVPTLYNLYDPTYGNKDLTPESTLSYDISVGYKAWKVTYFNSDIKDMIDYYDPDGWSGPIAGKYNNLSGTSTINGYELEYSDELLQDTLVSANYTRLLKAEDNNGIALARRALSTLNVSVDYYGFEKVHFALSAQYIGKRYDSADNQGAQTGEYLVANGVINYDVNKQFQVYAKLDNITNRYYQVIDGYATAPRSGYVGIKAKF